MAFTLVFTKSLGSASATSIAASQATAEVSAKPLLLNGSLGNYLSTTTTAAVAIGGTVLPLAAITGLTPGQPVADTTAVTLSNITRTIQVGTSSVNIWPPVSGVGVGNGDTIVFTGNLATIDTSSSTNTAIGRRVLITSNGNDSGITWTVVGTNASGTIITDTFPGANGAAQSNLDFVTVTSITPSGTTASTVEAGTNGVGSSPWITLNQDATSVMNTGFSVEVVSGSVNFTVQHTYDDPNMLLDGITYPLAFNHSVVVDQNATIDGVYTTPVTAIRVLINSGTGVIRVRVLQSSIG